MSTTYRPYLPHTEKQPSACKRCAPLTNRQQLLKWVYSNSALWNSTWQSAKAAPLPTDVVLKDSFLREHEDDLCAHSPSA